MAVEFLISEGTMTVYAVRHLLQSTVKVRPFEIARHSDMVPAVKEVELEDLTCLPGLHMVKGENPTTISFPLTSTHVPEPHRRTHVYTPTPNKYINK